MVGRHGLYPRPSVLNWIALATILSCSLSAYGAFDAGTGFYVTSDGYFVTCFRAVEGSMRVRLQKVNAVVVDAVVVAVDPGNNLALLKADGKFSSLQLGGAEILRNGTSILLVGYSSIDDIRQQPEIESGTVIVGPPSATDVSEFQTTIPAKPGFCGAPVVTRNGEVAGILVTGPHTKEGDHRLPHRSPEKSRVVGSGRALSLLKGVSSADERIVKRSRRRPADISDIASKIKKGIALVIVDTNRVVEEQQAEEIERRDQFRRERMDEESSTEIWISKHEADQSRQHGLTDLQMLLSTTDRDESSLRSQILSTEQRLLYMTRDSKDLSAASARSELENRLSYLKAELDRITRSKETAMRKLRELQLRK